MGNMAEMAIMAEMEKMEKIMECQGAKMMERKKWHKRWTDKSDTWDTLARIGVVARDVGGNHKLNHDDFFF